MRAESGGRLKQALLRAFPLLRNSELLQRSAVTLAITALARLGHYLPLHGVPVLLGQSITSATGGSI